MAVVNHQRKWLYLMEPHTASRAVCEFLKKNCGGSEVGHHHIDLPELVDRSRCHLDPRAIKDYDVLCTVRNPFDTLITKWRYSGKGGMRKERAETVARNHNMTVEELLESPLNKSQPLHEWVMGNVDHPNLNDPSRGLVYNANKVVYYEYLNDDISFTFGRPLEVPCNQKHVTEGKEPWQTYYRDQPELVEYLIEKWSGFLDQFGYRITGFGMDFDIEVDDSVRSRLVKTV